MEFYAYDGKLSSRMLVFYNPKMELARSVSVDFVKKLNPQSVCCLMDASGVRSLRLWKEAGVKDITANDISEEACNLMQKNFLMSKANISIVNDDANAFLKKSGSFDYIDLDPFGSPAAFLDSMIKRVNDNGVIAVTATDIGCLSGRYKDACMRKYSAKSVLCPFSKEIAVRILIGKAQSGAGKHGKMLFPVLVHYDHHYIRVYLQAGKGDTGGNGYVLFCPKCLMWRVSTIPVEESCVCGCKFNSAGPLWLGPLWDNRFLPDRIKHISEESGIQVVGFYDLHKFAKLLKLKSVPPIAKVIASIQALGFMASRTHFSSTGVRSDISYEEFVKVIS